MTIDLSDVPDHVELAVGDQARLELPSFMDSGNDWSVVGDDRSSVAEVSIEVAPPDASLTGDGSTEPPPMRLAQETAAIRALSPGETTVRLVLMRSFGEPEVSAEHTLNIKVVEAERPDR